MPHPPFDQYSRKDGLCIVSSGYKGRGLISNCLSRMPSFFVVYVTAPSPLKLSVHVYLNTNHGDILFVRQKLIYGRSRPLCFSGWRGHSSFEQQIYDLAQAGSGEISVKDAADHIRLFFMYCYFSIDQNIAILEP